MADKKTLDTATQIADTISVIDLPTDRKGKNMSKVVSMTFLTASSDDVKRRSRNTQKTQMVEQICGRVKKPGDYVSFSFPEASEKPYLKYTLQRACQTKNPNISIGFDSKRAGHLIAYIE